MGCCVAWKCLVACRFFESSQQPTCPQVLQSRKCTQVSPSLRHSSQPRLRERLVRTKAKWRHCVGMTSLPSPYHDRNAFMERRLQSRLHILGVLVAEINGVSSPASAPPRRRSPRIRRRQQHAGRKRAAAIAARNAVGVEPTPTAQILTSRMSSTTTHTPTGKLAAP
jgi:hypothetical protein